MKYWHKSLSTQQGLDSRVETPLSYLLSPCFQKNNHSQHSFALVISAALLLFSSSTIAQATNTESSEKLGNSLERGLTTGKPIWLEASNTKFFAVHDIGQTGQTKGAVIILHDADSHPDKPEVIQPLRNDLPSHGWACITIQLPYLSSISDYTNKQTIINQRINSAVAYMQGTGIGNIALLGHGTGAMAATSYLSEPQETSIQAFIAISLGMLDDPNNANSTSISQQLEKITVPILDIYGSNDLDHITQTAMSRALAAKISSDAVTASKQIDSYKRSAIAKSSTQNSQGYISYRQIVIKGASHDFSGASSLLTKRIAGWLERHAKGVAVNVPP